MKKGMTLICLSTILGNTALIGMELDFSPNGSFTRSKDLEESRIVTSVPTTRGFGIMRSAWDLFIAEEENLFADLKNKTFDVGNSSYHRKLSTSIEKFVENKNDQRLTETFELCRNEYKHQIKVEDSPALLAHIFLASQNKIKQQETRTKLEDKDKQTISTLNTELLALKATVEKQIVTMNQCLAAHNQEQEKTIEEQCKEIRRLKKGLCNLHKVNKTFVQPDDSYCSDDEGAEPEEVNTFYSNAHILNKIKIDTKLTETKQKIQRMIATLTTLNAQIQSILELNY